MRYKFLYRELITQNSTPATLSVVLLVKSWIVKSKRDVFPPDLN